MIVKANIHHPKKTTAVRNRNYLARSVALMLFIVLSNFARAQNPTDSLPDDPGLTSFSVNKIQDMNFGAFSLTSGGSIMLTNSGLRSATGGVVLMGLGVSYFQAMFEVEAPEGTIVTIMNGPNATLTGSNGGSLTLQLGTSSPTSPFTTTAVSPSRTTISIGGTLVAGTPASSPPGNYTGTFDIYFNYQ